MKILKLITLALSLGVFLTIASLLINPSPIPKNPDCVQSLETICRNPQDFIQPQAYGWPFAFLNKNELFDTNKLEFPFAAVDLAFWTAVSSGLVTLSIVILGRRVNDSKLVNKLILLTAVAGIIVSLNVSNYRTSTPSSYCLDCDKKAFDSVLGWPAVFQVGSYERACNLPNDDIFLGKNKVGCAYNILKTNYKYNGLAVDLFVTVLMGLGANAYIGRMKKSILKRQAA